MVWYKNIGKSSWRRPDGTVVPPGGTFEATVKEDRRFHARSHYRARLALVESPPSQTEGAAPPPPASPATSSDVVVEEKGEEESAAWTMKLSPRVYLERFPEGKHAAAAKALVKKAGGA